MTRYRILGGLLAGALLAGAAVLAADEDQVPLPLKLPKPAFAGTPKDAPPEAKDVEPVSDKPRPIPLVAKGTVNVALHKRVTTGAKDTFKGSLDLITDGDKEAYDGSAVELRPRLQWVQIDLGKSLPLSYVVCWHFHQEPVIFHDVIVQVSDDEEFIDGVTTIFNNDKDNSAGQGAGTNREYWETYEGKLIAANGVRARYVRLYSRGSTYEDPLNRYTEVEVYGQP